MSAEAGGDELTTKMKSDSKKVTRSKPYSKPGSSRHEDTNNSTDGEYVTIMLPIPTEEIKCEPQEFEEVFIPECVPVDIKEETSEEIPHKSPYNTRQKEKKTTTNTEVTVNLSNYNGIRCIPCGKYIHSHTELLEHFKSINHETLNCLRCNQRGFNIRQLISHLQNDHAIKNHHTEILMNMKNVLSFGVNCYSNFEFTCMFCDNMKYQYIENLREHLKRSHNYCMACGVALKKQADFIIHKYQHSKGEILFYKCLVCKLELKTSRFFLNHSINFHKSNDIDFERVPKEETKLSKKYDCPYCDVPLTHPQLLINHMALHKVYDCQTCKNKFAILYTKNSFIPLNCTLCELSNGDVSIDEMISTKYPKVEKNSNQPPPKTPSYLKNKYQTGMPNLPCLFCDDFRGNSEEIYNHLNEKHFMCRICLVRFNNQSEKNTHITYHKNNKITFYQCTIDLRTFKNLYELESHIIDKYQIQVKKNINKYYKEVNKVIPELNMEKILDNTQCPYCHAFLSSITFMLSHLLITHDIFECIKCLNKIKIRSEEEKKSKICRYCDKNIPVPISLQKSSATSTSSQTLIAGDQLQTKFIEIEAINFETSTGDHFDETPNFDDIETSSTSTSQIFDNVFVKLEVDDEPLDLP